jgi:hypothetical protein
MATVKQAIKEIDVVSFVEEIGEWPAGTTGTVVIDYGDVKMVEISNERGEVLDLPLVPVEKLDLIAKHSA